MTNGQELHDEAIVIDAVCPLLMNKKYIEWYKEGGATAVAPTVASGENAAQAIRAVGGWLRFVRRRDDLLLVRRAGDIERAKREGKLGIYLHFQGTDPLENDIDLVDAFKEAGVGIIQLTYNVKNRVGDGGSERTDSGLSYFGLQFVERCNEVGVIVDCSHTGFRTTMDAIEASTKPVVFSHANAKGVADSPRNIKDEQIKAVAATGGLVGIVGFPAFVADSSKPTLDQFIDHIDYDVNLVGIDHVGLGIDYYLGQHLVAEEEDAKRVYDDMITTGRWRPEAYPPPPHHFPEGIETPRTLPNLTARLLDRGYKADDIRKILGGNWMRVFRDIWG
ncbi:MAG: dipeptidase [Kiloniellales bacterium]|nr:dipeptidase [Kiloniellales bacterium]